jgi:hypothetical protein
MKPTCTHCGHAYEEHAKRDGWCNHTTEIIERINRSDGGIETRLNAELCDCPYFHGSGQP